LVEVTKGSKSLANTNSDRIKDSRYKDRKKKKLIDKYKGFVVKSKMGGKK